MWSEAARADTVPRLATCRNPRSYASSHRTRTNDGIDGKDSVGLYLDGIAKTPLLTAEEEVRLAREIRSQGARASMALKPATPIEPYEALLPELDMVLIMTVEPGFGGQKFLDLCLPKIRTARELMRKHGVETWLQVDGGVSLDTIERCAEAGADVFVAGSAVYSADDPDAMVQDLRGRAEAASA